MRVLLIVALLLTAVGSGVLARDCAATCVACLTKPNRIECVTCACTPQACAIICNTCDRRNPVCRTCANCQGSGHVEVDESSALVVKRDTATELELRAAFKLFDIDGNGVIITSALGSLLRALGYDNITEEELSEIDTDGSGTIDIDEFLAFMTAG
ncbi:troponin C-like [Paramacrobiotus metropolitanus]|uniref:troponin C-like n=1 Tax=Paramacrobiotus metropolitanus TaxID=2943436 RepID=UPI0024457B0E|nr:troponin C-like [Paramacrobiotus metropolitanus]XP_055342023.1 troponin C-like [Paramacrobiotus metropolitanus]XP_055342024.1 troponin C-like [Paramacrobiotus metropolitanus]